MGKQKSTWNEQQAAKARAYISQCVTELCKQNAFPEGITARFVLLSNYRVSGQTLYRHRDLWHPNHMSQQQLATLSRINSKTKNGNHKNHPTSIGANER
ncbi:hypothetical protein [Synechococcus sp. PCC 7335]|uniref:hypothetical protein n=1 Tax=Synechococcus sp. (strain ATCC 29403 / PCC 7335) TaxID=91464 RepID=UPI0002D3EA98|nr:hypothetical protein [Synechococcus sp. PCC 7335]